MVVVRMTRSGQQDRIVVSNQQDLETGPEGPVQKPGWLVGSKSSVTGRAVELLRKPLGVIGKG